MLVFCKYLCKKERKSKLITGSDNILRCHFKWARKFHKRLKIKLNFLKIKKEREKVINQKLSPCHEKLSEMSIRWKITLAKKIYNVHISFKISFTDINMDYTLIIIMTSHFNAFSIHSLLDIFIKFIKKTYLHHFVACCQVVYFNIYSFFIYVILC